MFRCFSKCQCNPIPEQAVSCENVSLLDVCTLQMEDGTQEHDSEMIEVQICSYILPTNIEHFKQSEEFEICLLNSTQWKGIV